MNIQLIGDNVQIKDWMKEIVAEKLQDNIDKLLVDFEADMKKATMKIGMIKDKQIYQINFDMWLPGNEHIFAKTEDKILQNAVIDLREAVETQIKKYKASLN